MAITQVANPSSVPSAVADYEAQNAHISAFNNIVNNQPFILTNSGGTGLPAIKLGTYIQFGGNLYVVDTEDYAISGTPVDGNNYIRLSGSTTLTAEWVQDVSSYVWNEVYGYKELGSYFLLPYLVVKDGTEYEKYSMALDASFGKMKATSLDTGQGANELYPMNQAVRTTDNVSFASVDASIIPRISLSTSLSLSKGEKYLFPAGLYIILELTGGTIEYSRDNGSTWLDNGVANATGRMFITNGSMVRWNQNAANPRTIYYVKF